MEGSAVKWRTFINGKEETRYGYIFKEVKAYENPREYIPKGYNFVSKSEYRLKTSYLIYIPKCKTIYWPEHFSLIDYKEEANIYTQNIFATVIRPKELNQTDRNKLKAVFDSFNQKYCERQCFLVNYKTRTRYWFKVEDDLEYISEVEQF